MTLPGKPSYSCVLFFIVLINFSFVHNHEPIFAEEVILTSGEKLEGKLVEQTDKYIKIDPGVGVAMTYYSDQIDTINGQKLRPAKPQPPIAAPTPVPQPQLLRQEQPQIPSQVQALKPIQTSPPTNVLIRSNVKYIAKANEIQPQPQQPRTVHYRHSYSSSSRNSGKDIAYAIFGLIFGVYSFFHGFTTLRKKRLIENIPTSTVRGLAMGLVELNGKATKTRTLVAPLTGTECSFYRYTVERLESRGRSSTWVLKAKGDSCYSPFYLDDSTGQILVLPKDAELVMPVDYTLTTGFNNPLPDNLIDFAERSGIEYKGFFGNYQLRFREWHITPDEPVFILGTAQEITSQLDEHRDSLSDRLQELKPMVQPTTIDQPQAGKFIPPEAWQKAALHVEHGLISQEVNSNPNYTDSDVMIGKGEHQLFILSDESQSQVVRQFSWQAFLGIWGGASLALVLLAYLLFRFDLWFRF